MYARIVTFHLAGITPAEYKDHVAEIAPTFMTWRGLLAKVWIADDDAGTYGGIYLFTDQGSADRTRETDLFRSMATNPAFTDLSVREVDVLDEPTAITASALAGARGYRAG